MSNQINIGDKVSVLDENLKGKVIGINGNKVQILDSDGFEWSYQANELVVYDKTKLLEDTPAKEKQEIFKSIKNKSNQWIQLGDLVSILDESVQGIVKAIKENEVTIENKGFESTYPVEQIIVYDSLLSKDKTTSTKKILDKITIKEKITSTSIIDLHNENPYLNKNTILENQIRLFKKELNLAIGNKQSQIIFIHGKGTGVLKNEIKSILDKNKIKYKKAPYRKFGQGALIVSLVGVKIILR